MVTVRMRPLGARMARRSGWRARFSAESFSASVAASNIGVPSGSRPPALVASASLVQNVRVHDHVGRGGLHVGHARERHAGVELFRDERQGFCHTRLAARAQAIKIGAPDEAGPRAEAESL